VAKLKGKAKAAFLRRMAKGRNKHTSKPRKRKRTHTKHTKHRKHTGGHVAKRKHSKKGHRRHHAGALTKYIPPTDKLVGMGAAFAYGKVEAAAATDQQHFLRKVPSVVPQIGRAGNFGALIWAIGVALRNQMVKNVAAGVLHVGAYQNGRGPSGAFTKDAQDFKLSGPIRGRTRDELMVEDYLRRNG
jgi:hypothetical protein